MKSLVRVIYAITSICHFLSRRGHVPGCLTAGPSLAEIEHEQFAWNWQSKNFLGYGEFLRITVPL